MVNKSSLLFVILAFVFLFGKSADVQSREVKSVVVGEVGKTLKTYIKKEGDDMLAGQCKSFKPTVEQIGLFFSKAYPIPGVISMHERDSPCYSAGSVVFEDGLSGEWILYSSGTAKLEWARGGSVDLLYKYNDWHDPFACTYGLGDEGEC